MSIEQPDKVDFVVIDDTSGDVWLTISDHLPWDEESGEHLAMLQEKLNAYVRFIESGEMHSRFPNTSGRSVVIDVAGKFPLSADARTFFDRASSAIASAGFKLQFRAFPDSELPADRATDGVKSLQ